ncbi:MAG: hypothetical protein HY873_02825 [Chloroflexi bacterium]|nr:hypothetical protein [Chloroflexota bacterium]
MRLSRRRYLRLAAVFSAAMAVVIAALVLSRWGPTVTAATTTVKAGSVIGVPDRYISPNITIQQGDTVEWKLAAGRHDVVEFANAFRSPMMIGSGYTSWSWTFNAPGIVGYYCSIHAVPSELDTNGDGVFTASDTPDTYNNMVGVVNVQAPATATPTETFTPDPSSTPAPTDTPTTVPTATNTATPTWTPTATDTPGPNTVPVDTGNYFFSPRTIAVRPGDTIRWINTSNLPHTSTSLDGLWDSGIIAPGGYFERTFSAEGSFNYECELHIDQNQSGRVDVKVDITPTSTPEGSPTAATTATATIENATLGLAQASPAVPPARPVRGPMTMNVGMSEYAFDPAGVSLYAGDTVRWTNNGTMPHNTTANGGAWSSAILMQPGESYSFTFSAPGTYAYQCSLHAAQGQVGVIVVREGLPTALPAAGQGPDAGPAGSNWLVIGASAAAMALAAGIMRARAARRRRVVAPADNV